MTSTPGETKAIQIVPTNFKHGPEKFSFLVNQKEEGEAERKPKGLCGLRSKGREQT